MFDAPRLTRSIRDHFLADHDRLESLLDGLLAAFEADDREDAAALWTELDTGLQAHMDAEETHMIPLLREVAPDDAALLLEEHASIRRRLLELSLALDLHLVRLQMARDFIDALRTHARDEDRLLYRWVDEHADEPRRASIFAAPWGGATRRRTRA